MKSPESIPLQEKQWKKEISAHVCKSVNDILKKLQRAVNLPEGKTADDESIEKAGDIMNYAERVLANDQFWKTVPEDVPTILKGHTVKRDALKTNLSNLIKESK